MDTFQQLLGRVTSAWARATPSGRVGAGVAITVLVGTVIATAIWSSMPDYKLLRDGISPSTTGDIVSALDANGIPNKMNYSGTGVLVPSSRWNEANIAIASLNVSTEGPSSAKKSPLFASRPGHEESVRAKEMALEKGLSSLHVVHSADVHLSVPERSPFRSKRQSPSASVIIEPAANQIISHEKGLSIIHIVASAVEGLDPKNVTLTDANGGLIGTNLNGDPAAVRRGYVADLESGLAMKAQDVLAAVLGPHRSVVRVTAEVDDFLDKVTTSQAIKSGDKVRLTEKLTSTDQKGGATASGGVAGVASNSASTLGPSSSNQPILEKSETTETSYDYPRETIETREVGGQVLRLSISATVDIGQDAANNSNPQAGAAAATPPLTKEEVENLIKNAVGFSSQRGDQIEVVLATFSALPTIATDLAIPETQKWEFVAQLARNASLGLTAIVALLLGMMIIKKLKPIEVSTSSDRQQHAVLAELSDRIGDNPEAVSKILAAWIGHQESADENPTDRMNKAA